MSPPIVLVLGISVLFGSLATLFLVIGVSTDSWEETRFSGERLRMLALGNGSALHEDQQLFRVVLASRVYYLRALAGGIWRICDKISDEFQERSTFKEYLREAPHLQQRCFHYIPDYNQVKNQMTDRNGRWLVRMQNSAASCSIVSLMCLVTAAVTGIYGLTQKQVSACMVTGVMYIVGGVFDCFALVIMHTKIRSMDKQCFYLQGVTDLPLELCSARDIGTGLSIPFAWLAFAFMLIAFVFWLYMARCLRLEKAKTLI